jgi:hypothetical protein
MVRPSSSSFFCPADGQEIQHLIGLGADARLFGGDGTPVEPGVPQRLTRLPGGHHHQVFAHGHRTEFMRDLKGAQQAFGKQHMWGQARDILAVHQDAARCGGQASCDDVEKRGLACAVGTDQPGDRAGLDGQRRAIDGTESPEMAVKVLDNDHSHPLRAASCSGGSTSRTALRV